MRRALDFASLREAIAAGALTDLAAKCGASADLALADVVYLPTITDPAKICA